MPGNGSSAGSSGHRVLIVESDDAIRRLLGLALESFGCEAYLARDGPEVIEALRGHAMCAVIVDVPGPDRSCWSVLQAAGRPIAGRRRSRCRPTSGPWTSPPIWVLARRS